MVASINYSGFSGRARGAATQTRILEKAVHIASVEGLEAMSLATLAKATAMSKSGLFAHFRSKEALQVSIVDEAERIFSDAVIRPAMAEPPGLERLTRLVDGYVEYCAAGPFQGGCFFAAAAHEFDGRPGLVRDRIVAFYDGWERNVRSIIQEGQQRGDVHDAVDAGNFLFELQGIGFAANFAAQLGAGAERARQRGLELVRALVERSSAVKN